MDFRSQILARVSVMNIDENFRDLVSRVGDHVIQLESKDRGSSEVVILRLSAEGIAEAPDDGESSLRICGPSWAWSALFDKEMPYIAAISGYHGALTVSGTPVVGAWLTPALSRLFS